MPNLQPAQPDKPAERQQSGSSEVRAAGALLCGELPEELRTALIAHIREQRWFRGKARKIQALSVLDHLPLGAASSAPALLVVRVTYEDQSSELYVLPVALSTDTAQTPHIGRMQLQGAQATLIDPSGREELSRALLELFVRERTEGVNGEISARPSAALRARVEEGGAGLAPRIPSGEQSNTSVFYGRELMVKLFRQLEPGENPDVELNDYLWANGYRHVPEPLGSLSYELDGTSYTLGIAQRFVESEGIAWEVTLDVLGRSLELALALAAEQIVPPLPQGDVVDGIGQAPPESIDGFISAYAPFATLLGERTAELHLSLAAPRTQPAFAPEAFTADYQQALVQATRERIARAFDLLSTQRASLPPEVQPLAEEVLRGRESLAGQLEVLDRIHVRASRIRCHGDYHLGQVLYGHNDFTILDFEGEPAQPLAARRQKLSALYDVAGMIRSFHYAATVALQHERFSPDDRKRLEPWAEAWFRWISASYLCAYLRKAREHGAAVFLPQNPTELRALFRLHTIDKCSYELSYELNNRPAWVAVPLTGLRSLIDNA